MCVANLKKLDILKWLSLKWLKVDVSCDEQSQQYLHQLKTRRYNIPITYIFGIVKFPVPLN